MPDPEASTPPSTAGSSSTDPVEGPSSEPAGASPDVVANPSDPPSTTSPTSSSGTSPTASSAGPADGNALDVPDDLATTGDVARRGSAAAAPRPLPRVIAIANQKGGVGKTTTAVNLGAALAERGFRVLLLDLDPQGNASTGLGLNVRELDSSLYDVLLDDLPMRDCILPTEIAGLSLAPANLDLAGAEIELVSAFSRELKLRNALQDVRDDYDYLLVDCPPSLGLLTINAMAAATEVIVPIQCEYYALEGLGQLLRNVELVQRNLNPKLEVSAIVLVMYDARTKLADQVAHEVRTHFADKVCRTVVPRTVRLSEAPSFGQPILTFDSTSRGAIAYRELAREVSGGAAERVG